MIYYDELYYRWITLDMIMINYYIIYNNMNMFVFYLYVIYQY